EEGPVARLVEAPDLLARALRQVLDASLGHASQVTRREERSARRLVRVDLVAHEQQEARVGLPKSTVGGGQHAHALWSQLARTRERLVAARHAEGQPASAGRRLRPRRMEGAFPDE